MRPTALATLLLLLVPVLATAQMPPYDQVIRASAALRSAAQQSLDPAVNQPRVSDDVLAQRRRRRDRSTGTTLMIIGAGSVVVGAIVGGGGGTVLIIGGVAAAGYGFYLYQQR